MSITIFASMVCLVLIVLVFGGNYLAGRGILHKWKYPPNGNPYHKECEKCGKRVDYYYDPFSCPQDGFDITPPLRSTHWWQVKI